MGVGCSRAPPSPELQDFLQGGYGSPISKEGMKLALTSAGQAGYSDVRIMIHDTFPVDMKKYGTVYIQINTKDAIDLDKPRIIRCGGRPSVDVSRELKQLLGFEAMGFTVIYIPPASSSKKGKGYNTPHFVAFHKYDGCMFVAWASEIHGLSTEPIRNIPVVWKLSEDVPTLTDLPPAAGFTTTEKSTQSARAGGVQLVDIRPCLAGFTFWFVGCRVTISHMVEVTKYDAKMIEESARKENRERIEKRDKDRQHRQRLHERRESDLESVALASQMEGSEASTGEDHLYDDGLESLCMSSEFDAHEIQIVAEVSLDPDMLDEAVSSSGEEEEEEEKKDNETTRIMHELLNGYNDEIFEEKDADAEVRDNIADVLAQHGIGGEDIHKLLAKMRS